MIIEEVFSVTPNGQIITFESLAKAKMILLNKYHPYIVEGFDDFIRKYSLEQMKDLMLNQLKLNKHAEPTITYLTYTDKVVLGKIMWPMLIAHGRRTRDALFNPKVAKAMSTHTMYYSDYVPGKDPARDLNYVNMALQAQVLVNIITDTVVPTGKEGMPEYVLRKVIEKAAADGVLVTRQDPWHIFWYYKPQLVSRGFLTIVKAGGVR